MTLFVGRDPDDAMVREAAWVARCVGRSDTVPFDRKDLRALASYMARRDVPRGGVLYSAGDPPSGVFIVQSGALELVVGSGRRRVVVELLHPGDVDGDIQLLLNMSPPYTARAVEAARCLVIGARPFERLLQEHPAVARRWLSSVATRLARSQRRILELLGKSLQEQLAKLIATEAVDGRVALPQKTLAAMLGVHRPSVNKILKRFEAEGLLELGYGEIKLGDCEALLAFASATPPSSD